MELGTGLAIIGASIAIATMCISLLKYLRESGKLKDNNGIPRKEYEQQINNLEHWFQKLTNQLENVDNKLDKQNKEQQKLCSSRGERIAALETKLGSHVSN